MGAGLHTAWHEAVGSFVVPLRARLGRGLLSGLALGCCAGLARAQCPSFPPPGPAGEVFAAAVFQGEFYVGGDFDAAGGVAAANLARWNGTSWSAVGAGVGGAHGGGRAHALVSALAVFDAGSGPELWIGGSFTSAGGQPAASIARWNGTSFTPVPPAAGFDGLVLALVAHDPDGGGPAASALYAGGAFARAGGAQAGGLARWNGLAWQPVPGGGGGGGGGGAGVDGAVHALASHAGSLFLGGRFEHAGGAPAANLARYDGSFHALAGGTDGLVQALGVATHGLSPELYLAGSFTHAGGVLVDGVARYTGAGFAPLGGGVSEATPGPRPARVFGLSAVDTNSDGHEELAVAGRYTAVGMVAVPDAEPFGRAHETILALWDGASWTQLGRLGDDVRRVLTYNGELVAVGRFQTADQDGASRVARYDALQGRWRSLGIGTGLGGAVRALALHDFGGGPVLVAAGDFRAAGTLPARGLARWANGGWSALGEGVDDRVHALASFGGQLVCAGEFSAAGSASARHVAAFDGAGWSALGAGLGHDAYALAVFGGALVAGGDFRTAGGAPASCIARFDGASWSSLGLGLDEAVRALAVFDDGSGAKLYAGGDFERAGRVWAQHVARWNGSRWEAVGLGCDAPVHALAVFDDGSGAALYAGGEFARAGSQAARHVARWDGIDWTPLGAGTDGVVHALAAQGSGASASLWVGGEFAVAGGAPSANLARWHAGTWSPSAPGPASGTDAGVLALLAHPDGRVYAGGGFTRVNASQSSAYLAAFGCLP